MGHRFVDLRTIQARMEARDRRMERALAPRLRAAEQAPTRYCEMCDEWVFASETECRACGMPTVKAPE